MRVPALCVVLLVAGGCGRAGPPYSPADAVNTFKIEPGFRIDTYVSEPDIRSPVAMEFDENGRIYVVEAPGYPLKMDAKVGGAERDRAALEPRLPSQAPAPHEPRCLAS